MKKKHSNKKKIIQNPSIHTRTISFEDLSSKKQFYLSVILILTYTILVFVAICLNSAIITFEDIFSHYDHHMISDTLVYLALCLLYYIFFCTGKSDFYDTLKTKLLFSFFVPLILISLPVGYKAHRHAKAFARDCICYVSTAEIIDINLGMRLCPITVKFQLNGKTHKRKLCNLKGQLDLDKVEVGNIIIISYPIYSLNSAFINVLNENPDEKIKIIYQNVHVSYNGKFYKNIDQISINTRDSLRNELFEPHLFGFIYVY